MKPDNILIKSTKGKPLFKVVIFNIQIGDFGLGKCIEAAGSDLKTKNIGTPYYFAPEIANA
jgi:serine/threonine protein kinase